MARMLARVGDGPCPLGLRVRGYRGRVAASGALRGRGSRVRAVFNLDVSQVRQIACERQKGVASGALPAG